MISDDVNQQGAAWPTPKFHFEVDFGQPPANVAFEEVLGLDQDANVIEYRPGKNAPDSATRMPGVARFGNVIMKRGMFVNDIAFWQWVDDIRMNTIARSTILIKLLGEDGSVSVQWQLNNAWPSKITGADLQSDANEVAVDTLEVAYQQLICTNGKG